MRQSGVTFQVVPAGTSEDAARMDVAGFVGLAMSGPLHTPVPVADPVQFDQVFGGTYTLAWDRRTGALKIAHLRAAVHSFFAGGGARCWVVRAAGDGAVANRFVAPGVMRIPGGAGSPRSALLKARSVGAWSDRLLAGTSLHRTPLGNCQFHWPGRVSLDPWMMERVAPGDLLRISFAGQRLLLFLTADEIADQIAGRAFWFRRPELLPVNDQRVKVICQNPLPPEAAGAPPVSEPAITAGYWAPRSPRQPELLLRAAEAPHPGATVTVHFARGAEVVLNVQAVREATREERNRWAGQLGDLVVVTLREPLERLQPTVMPENLSAATAERLAFDLWAQDSEGRLTAARDLALTGRHPRFAGYLPDDETLFASPVRRGSLRDGDYPGQSLWPLVREPRFPLAAADQNAYAQTDDVWLPLGMGAAGPDLVAGAVHPDLSPHERDGLSDWSPTLLADPLLVDVPADALEFELLQRITEGTAPLQGFHGLWPVTEVTLVALPDAGHGGWQPQTPVAALQAPELAGTHGVDGRWHLAWSPVGDRLIYRLQWATDDGFRHDMQELTGGAQSHAMDPPPDPSREYYFRVRAERYGEPGPWSATVTAFLPRPDFAPSRPVALPGLRLEPDGGGLYRALWPHAGADWYELQTSHSPDFADPLTIYAGPRPGESVWHSGTGAAYFRLRARWGEYWGPWSGTVVVPGEEAPARWQPAPGCGPGHRAALLALHSALLRLSAIRGDLFALLSLPERYQDSEVSAYSRQLAAELRRSGGEKALSFGALYHPWVWVREGSRRLLGPPDGPMAGQFAERARQQGVWFPAANRPLVGVEDLADPVEAESRAILERERVNVLAWEGRGVRVMTAVTLSREPELKLITARRLLSQIRRTVLEEGSYLVFEPNDERLRRNAIARCERVLTSLFEQGAFAGATPEECFSVTVSPNLGGRHADDSGRFSLDLAVAPSRPLSFITVRLVQSQSGGVSIREG